MKFLSKISFVFLLSLFLYFTVNAQSEWIGSYQFDEDGGKTVGGTAIFVTHQIDILEGDDGLIAMIQSNGYQTSRDLVGTTKIQGDKLLVHFDSYGENNVFETYKKGDMLFTLERKTVKEKTEILTFWDKFQPVVPKNEKGGKVYFQKIESK
jgi:hypothetical protein